MPVPDSILSQLARCLQVSPPDAEAGTRGSIFGITASAYSFRARHDELELTQPTGFDPQAVRLFEALIEGAYLVLCADGPCSEAEHKALVQVVLKACTGVLSDALVRALLDDARRRLEEDGLERRLEIVAWAAEKPEQAREIVRVAALLAGVSGSVSASRRTLLHRLAARLSVDDLTLTRALQETTSVLSGR